ncbi:ATPase family AAA domain-containing protein 5 [Rhinophrynus dorsalis]
MVGVLTMSSPVEDYTVQPCKKQRKDEDPSIKTITNYFSPLTKTKEKILVSPRPSNITDYFKRNYPACETEQTPVTEINISGQDSEIELLSSYSPPTSVTGHLRVSGKLTKGRKRVNMCRRVSDLSGKREGDSGSERNEITDTENVCKNTGFMGSDTAALLAEICSKREDLYERNQLETPKSPETSSKHCSNKAASPKYKNSCSKSRNHQHDEDKGEHTNSVKEDNEYLEDKLSGISTTSLGSTNTTNTSLEVNVGDTTPRNDSVCTVYFNDFLKSQEKRDSETLSDGKGTVLDCSVSSNGENENSAGQGNEMPAQNPSPKTVTVRAQVHLSPPLQTTCSQSKVPKKIASIFLKKKDEVGKKADELTCKQEHADHMTQKRKSNVVVSEEDLELAVLDVESIEPIKQKCTAVERQQFMKAFRQPGEGGKNAGKKSLGKKDPSEMSTKDGADSHSRTDDCPPLNMTGKEECQKQIQADKQEKTQELKNMKEKRTVRETTAKRANKRKAEHTSDATTEVTSSPLTSPGLRRSSRYRASAIKSPVKSPPVTDCPIQMSTPKVRVSCRKSDIYRAEVISAPSDVESPIRMRFTRLSVRKRQQSRKSSVADDDSFTPKSTKVTGSSKKAKKLLEKAKAIKQTVTKPVTPRRRSSRQQARSAERQPLEDCVIVEENLPLITPSADTKVGKKRNLRSLNEVLGKVPKKLKNPNISSGLSKSGKNVKTPHITVIDDSPEASENSQDEEQFRAKQEFLKSGLPDSLKRHIAKTAALLEAYSLSGSSFQTVVHVQQRDGCPMWGLSMPACPRLTGLFPLSVAMRDLSSLCLSLGQFTCVRTMPGSKQQSSLVNRRQVFSDTVRDWLLEEIRSSNPQFPVRRFFNQFLKKQNDLLVLQEAPKQVKSSRLADHKEEGKQVEEIGVTGTGSRTKRKGEDSPGIKSKRRRFVAGQTEVCDKTLFPKDQEPPSQTAAREKLPRASRKKLKRLEQDISPDVPHCEEAKQSSVVSDTINEDVLWTEKYQPQNSSEMIGNSSAIKQLHGWLKEWKVRAEKDEKRSQMQKTDKDKSDAWDHSDFLDSDSEEEETLCNTMLITGPSGVGKTAAVYACAQELGFKVFEVNASCQRSGRQILTHLKEATQSHQVDQQGVNAHKPCFFNSLNTAKSPRKINSPKNVVSSPRKPPASPRGAGNRKGLAPKSLANFFKAHPKQKTEEKRKIHEVPKEAVKVELSLKDTERRINRNHQDTVQQEQGSEESHRKMATSLILFEEVDVIFDDDYGFLSAIKTFMSTAKRPVILTTSGKRFVCALHSLGFCFLSLTGIRSCTANW